MGATCHKKVDWLQEQTEKSLGATMSRSYLLMVGGDLLLAISLLMVVNVLIIGSVISPETFALIDPVHLGVMCLALLGAKYTLRLYRFYRNDKLVFKKSFMRILTATLLPITAVIEGVA